MKNWNVTIKLLLMYIKPSLLTDYKFIPIWNNGVLFWSSEFLEYFKFKGQFLIWETEVKISIRGNI